MNGGMRPWLSKAAPAMVTLLAGSLMTGCGGGGGSGPSADGTSPDGSAVASYVTDQQGASFTGSWWTGNHFAATPVASATARTHNLTATAQPTTFDVATRSQALVSGTWSDLAVSSGGYYGLTPNGWAYSSNDLVGSKFVDSGNGTDATLVLANGSAYTYAITRTDLAGANVTCPGTCTTPATYPPGSARYDKVYTSNFYYLYNLADGWQVTDVYGTALSSLPTANATTFCDPLIGTVYDPRGTKMSSNPDGWLYYVYFLASGQTCTSGAIASALGTAPQQQVTITWLPTGVPAAPTVLKLTNWFPIYPNMSMFGFTNPWFYALRGGYVWEGLMVPANTSAGSAKNKAAINAELQASGYTALP